MVVRFLLLTANFAIINELAGDFMKFGEFMVRLKRGEMPHVFLLAGEERYYIDKAEQAIRQRLAIADDSAVQKINGDVDIDSLVGLIETIPFFNSTNVIIIKNANFLREKKAEDKAKKNDKLARLIDTLENMPEFSYVLFISTVKVDKRKKIYKAIEKNGLVLDAEPLKAWNINEWLQGKLQSQNRTLEPAAMEYFAGIVSMMREVSLEYLDSEFDKLALYGGQRVITKNDMVKLFAGLPEVSIFSLMDAISEQNARKAIILLKRELESGTYFTVLITLITRHVRQLWQAKELAKRGLRGQAIAKPLELNPYIAEKLSRAAGRFDEKALRAAMLELIDADYLLKSGKAGDELLEHALISLCRR